MAESPMVRELRVAVFHSPTSAEADLFRRAANELQRQDERVASLVGVIERHHAARVGNTEVVLTAEDWELWHEVGLGHASWEVSSDEA